MRALPEIPSGLRANWRRWASSPAVAEAAIADVGARLGAAVDAWALEDPRLLSGGEVALVLAVRCRGEEAVLKLSPRLGADGGGEGEGAALARWAERGVAPRVLGRRDDGLTLLLARVVPGLSLRETGADAREIAETIGALCPSLHVATRAGEFVHLRAHAEAEGWAAGLAGSREADELAGLLAPGSDDRLLHTDLHWLNVLRGGDRWLAIDPKPHLGDPHAETFAFLDGPPLREASRGRTAAQGLTGVYARAAGLDADRLRTWTRLRAHVVLSQPDVAAGAWGERLARLVDALD